MLRLEEALERVWSSVQWIGEETVPLREAHGRILSCDVVAPRSIPAWDNSAMDGYAVCASDFAPSGALPSLEVLETIAAGEVGEKTVRPGSCSRIMTGAPMPPGADSVVMVEQTRLSEREGWVEFKAPVHPGQNVRLSGNDVMEGSLVLEKGRRLDPPAVGMLSSLGIPEVAVAKRVSVAVLSTGDEVVEAGKELGPGQIYSSNTHSLMGQIAEIGCIPIDCGNAPDDLAGLHQALGRCVQADVIVTTGGVSVGDFDYVKEAYEAYGSSLDFWKVCMKPGKPLAFGQIAGKPAFGLPGNPVSCMVNFAEFVRPVLLGMMGARKPHLPVVDAVLSESISKKPGRALLSRVRLSMKQGRFQAEPFSNQSSGALTSMVAADGLALLNVECDGLAAGDSVRVQVLRWDWLNGEAPDWGW